MTLDTEVHKHTIQQAIRLAQHPQCLVLKKLGTYLSTHFTNESLSGPCAIREGNRVEPVPVAWKLDTTPYSLIKNVKSGKGPLTPAGLLKLVKRFEETGMLEDRARAGRPCLKEARAPYIAVEMEAIASEAASGTSSARKAARRLGLPPSSVRNILRRILQLYPYKLQSCHELLPADTAQRGSICEVGLL
ncbi:uncharacterized protein TNCV_748321 [Trichonephila clavipes]|nr:uncharacterized protein TNCV_748321 [Trichonephila clavipes]